MTTNRFKDEIITVLKANPRIQFNLDVVLNNAWEKGKPLCNISYKVLKSKDEYDQFPYIHIKTN